MKASKRRSPSVRWLPSPRFDPNSVWQSPFADATRAYASREMIQLWSNNEKFATWRLLWYFIAKCQKMVGLKLISQKQIKEMEHHLHDRINFRKVARIEAEVEHDVEAHKRAWGIVCPAAAPIMHLGCTSCSIENNASLVVQKKSLQLIVLGLAKTIHQLARFAEQWSEAPTTGLTHIQAAQSVTIGKRAAMWLYDLLLDLREIKRRDEELPFLGLKGPTGTQADLLKLFDGDARRVLDLERMLAEELGFSRALLISGQTYTRKYDMLLISALAGIGATAVRITNDLRLLAAFNEMREPRKSGRVSSTGMPWKSNPKDCERVSGMGETLSNLAGLGTSVYKGQAFERTLNDSSALRTALPEAFLAADAVLRLMQKILSGLVVNEEVVIVNLYRHLPFSCMGEVLTAMVQAGVDRQAAHQRIRDHAMKAYEKLNQGHENDLLVRISEDPYFFPVHNKLDEMTRPDIGLSALQVQNFLANEVAPALEPYQGSLEVTVNVDF